MGKIPLKWKRLPGKCRLLLDLLEAAPLFLVVDVQVELDDRRPFVGEQPLEPAQDRGAGAGAGRGWIRDDHAPGRGVRGGRAAGGEARGGGE